MIVMVMVIMVSHRQEEQKHDGGKSGDQAVDFVTRYLQPTIDHKLSMFVIQNFYIFYCFNR